MKYMWHAIKMLIRPVWKPWIFMQRRSEAARQQEYEVYKKNADGALAALKLELLLAREQADDAHK